MTEPQTLVHGVVTNIKDPTFSGRIKVALPQMDGGEFPEWIAPVSTPGWLWLPEPGDTVLVSLPSGEDLVEFADELRWIGQVFDEDNQHPKDFKANYPKVRGFKTKAGHTLLVDDEDKKITLSTKSNYNITIDEKTSEVSLTHKGSMIIKMTDAGIFFGTGSASENVVLGQQWKTMMSDFLTNFLSHTHPTGVGPSGPPANPELGQVTTIKAGVDAGDQLSDFIFSQKGRP
jgi:hypothetical protein